MRRRLRTVKRRTRHVTLAVSALAGLIYARIARDWSFAAFLSGEAVVILVVGGIGLPWQEFAPDGAFRRRPQT
jgi:hypothetical protein